MKGSSRASTTTKSSSAFHHSHQQHHAGGSSSSSSCRLLSSGRSVALMTLLLLGNMMAMFLNSCAWNYTNNNPYKYNPHAPMETSSSNHVVENHAGAEGDVAVVERLMDGRLVIPGDDDHHDNDDDDDEDENDNDDDDDEDNDDDVQRAESEMDYLFTRITENHPKNNNNVTNDDNHNNGAAAVDRDELLHNNNAQQQQQQQQSEPLNYLRHPDAVIQVFQECTADPDCYFTYHHVSKTGGTSIEQAFFPHFQQPIESTCCHGRILAKFRDNPQKYCAQKFTSWQASFRKFYEIVDTCRNEIRPHSRTVVWVTFREPLTTLVSLIHQMCNKNVGKRDEAIRRACEICAYTNETAPIFGRQLAQTVEWQLKGAYRTSHRYLNETNVTTVVMEPADLNDFWSEYYLATTQNNNNNVASDRSLSSLLKHSNAEKISQCSFQLTTALIKKLNLAQNIYRRMVGGTEVPFDMLDVNGIVGGRVSDKDLSKFKKKKTKTKKTKEEEAAEKA